MMENGKIIKKIKITELSEYDNDITLGKVYDVLTVNELGRVGFLNDAGNWDTATKRQYEIVEEPNNSLVGRYLKALCDDANRSDYREGDYIKIDEEYEEYVFCENRWNFMSTDWEGSQVELMPEGFEPTTDISVNNEIEQELRFRDEFQKELNEIDDKEFEGITDIFKAAGINPKPVQYNIGIDTFERMRANATYEEAMGFIRWNIDKYNTRQKGQDKEDYEKIISYAQEALWWIKNNK
jgi:hypothetical protein